MKGGVTRLAPNPKTLRTICSPKDEVARNPVEHTHADQRAAAHRELPAIEGVPETVRREDGKVGPSKNG